MHSGIEISGVADTVEAPGYKNTKIMLCASSKQHNYTTWHSTWLWYMMNYIFLQILIDSATLIYIFYSFL